MSDQADGLRQLVRARRDALVADAGATGVTRRLLLVGAKGGVGASCLAANLAVALAARGRRVGVVAAGSARPHLGLLLGLGPRVQVASEGVRLLTADELEGGATAGDDLVVDAGQGLDGVDPDGPGEIVVVTTPEPPALADARALLRRLAASGRAGTWLVVNQADGAAEARECLDRLAAWCRHGLGLPARPLGHVRRDPRVPRAVRAGRPFVLAYPHGRASRDVARLARRLDRTSDAAIPAPATAGRSSGAPPPK